MAILVDASHAVHRSIWMNKEAVIENPAFLSHLIISQYISFANKLGASKENPLIIALDSRSWRKEYYEKHKVNIPDLINESYKGNRTKDETIPWDKIYEILEEIHQTLEKYSDFYVVKADGAEADDVIACLTKELKKHQDIWIASSDKDFIQLQDENVRIYDPMKQQFRPTQNIDLYKKIHVMIGDASDNIKPIKARVGEKTAVKMLKDLDLLLQTNPDMKVKYDFNSMLIDFDNIPEIINERIMKTFSQQKFSFNFMELMKIFQKYKLAKHAEDASKFKLPEKISGTKLTSQFNSSIINTSSLEDLFS